MAVLFMDLDNTLIYSHRHEANEPVVWIEELNGRKQSYVTKKTLSYLKSQNRFDIIPITTRTGNQYSRLHKLARMLNFKNALICNGAVLLVDGKEDAEWTRRSEELCRQDGAELYRVLECVRGLIDDESIISVEPFMFYAKADKTEELFAYLSEIADESHIAVYKDSRKVYCISRQLSKGRALERMRKRSGEQLCAAAGDSDFDISMLNAADLCFCPGAIYNRLKPKGKAVKCDGVFSNRICEELEKIRNEES